MKKYIKSIKEIFINLMYILSIFLLVYSIFTLFLDSLDSGEYELSISSKNEKEIHNLLSKNYKNLELERITKLKLEPLLGESRLYLYSSFHLLGTYTIGEGDEVGNYMLEHGNNPSGKHLLYILLSLIVMLSIKSYKNTNILDNSN